MVTPVAFDASARRSPQVAAALCIALGGHALLLAAASALHPAAAPSTRDRPSPARALFVVPARSVEPRDAARSADTTRPRHTRVDDTSPAAAPPAWARSKDERTAQVPVRFYALRDVHTPAAPLDDWNLDVDTLDRLGLTRLAFELLIDAGGEIVECTVIDPPALAPELRADLERRLGATRMSPAIRDGRAVASARRIELFVASERADGDAAALS